MSVVNAAVLVARWFAESRLTYKMFTNIFSKPRIVHSGYKLQFLPINSACRTGTTNLLRRAFQEIFWRLVIMTTTALIH